MRVCTTYGSPSALRPGSAMHEIRADVFGSMPKGIGKDDIITLCGRDPSIVPKDFEGLVDVGDSDIDAGFRRIRSVHDFERTPDADTIVGILKDGTQEISKGAFAVGSLKDLHSIYLASKALDRKHLILGMGELGKVTRIRQSLLGNEFTFGYSGESTAPGQLSSDEMESLGDDCSIIGIIGNPLSHTKSPAMQDAAMRDKGINGRYLVFETPDLEHVNDVLIEYDIRGVNVTIPYKQDIIDHLDSLSRTAESIGAVNTVMNTDGKLKGHNTDVDGIRYAVNRVIGDREYDSVLIMGSGGAARAAVYAFTSCGKKVSVSGRNRETVSKLCGEFGISVHEGDVSGFDLIVNCTPIGLVEGDYPSDTASLNKDQTVFDMVYGRPTPLISAANRVGCRTVSGEDMLLGQGAASFHSWFGQEPNIEVMRCALR